ncbi:hypothetical protein [Cupriavidus sp. a3]
MGKRFTSSDVQWDTITALWMRADPSIEIVARDRAGAYSEAVDIALPAVT